MNRRNSFTGNGKNSRPDENRRNQGILIGIGIGVVLYVMTGSEAMVVVGLLLGLVIGTAAGRKK